jgi:1-acyl-sn-glycerol-3-phosphate acyltransferase
MAEPRPARRTPAAARRTAQPPAGKVAGAKASAGKASAGKASAGKASAGKASAGRNKVTQAKITPAKITAVTPEPVVGFLPPSPNGRVNGKVHLHPGRSMAGPDVWDRRVAGVLDFLRRRLTGEYPVDEFGFDPELTEMIGYPLLRLLYRRYFRVDTTQARHLPVTGPALVVANHSGTVPLDALMLSIAVHDETPGRRHLRLLAADLVFRVPVMSEISRKSGATLACNPDAERLLRNGALVGVFPEGFKGVGKRYSERYKLQRFGRGGFVSAAMRTGTPIVPAAIVGAEEIYPILGNAKPLARIAGLPYFPLTPTFPWLGPLGMIPLPSKWLIEFGEPIPTAGIDGDPDDPIVVFNLADQVRETIQQTLHRLLQRRPDPFG